MTDPAELGRRIAARLRGDAGEPVSNLIVDDVWLAVVEGSLSSGERLPTPRQLAVELGVSPRAVDRAYRALEARGVVARSAERGVFVSLRPPKEEERERHRRFADLCRETFDRTTALGFSVEDLIDALSEFRGVEGTPRGPEASP